jgi:hypothetical protein
LRRLLTQCVAAPHNSVYWDDFGSGILNPRALRTKSDLHPGETLEVLQIPLVASTPFPISISIEYWLRNQQSGRQSLILREPPAENDLTFDLAPGELALNAGADGGFAQSALKWPQDLFVEGLLINIAQHLRPEEFGVVDFGVDAVKPTQATYRAHLAQSGAFWSMDRASLTIALDNLVSSGRLDPADNMGKAAS